MKREFNLFLFDILNSINKIKTYVKDISFKDFKNNELIIDAVTRNFEIIGEAVSNIPLEIKNTYSYIPWRDIKDMRNSIIHNYWKVDLNIEWDIIKTKLDILEKQIKEIFDDLDN
jgi:uncharacterized protein with HEPN domain